MVGRRLRGWLTTVAILIGPAAVLGGCADDEPAAPPSFAPLTYGYLRPLRLNVGSIEISDGAVATPEAHDVAAQSPASPVDTLRQMARDRLIAAGTSGRAVFSIEQASIAANGPTLDGLFKVRLDIYSSNGREAAFAEAAVARRSGSLDDDGENATRMALYGLTKQMMNDMNVELEFQLRRALGDWLQTSDAPTPVQQEPLAAPAGTPAK